MKTLIAVAAAWLPGILLTAFAQGGTDLPPGPLIQPSAPNFSTWTITCAYSTPAEKAAGRQQAFQQSLAKMAASDPVMAKFLAKRPAETEARPRALQIRMTKTDDVRQQATTFEGGKQEESWVMGGVRMKKDPFSGKISLATGGEAVDGAGDFPEFTWISKDNFRGIKRIEGRDCLIFEGKVGRGILDNANLALGANAQDLSEDAFIQSLAAVDMETRLPVMQKWEDQTRSYAFGVPPAQKLSLPEDFLRVVNQSLNRAQTSTAPFSQN